MVEMGAGCAGPAPLLSSLAENRRKLSESSNEKFRRIAKKQEADFTSKRALRLCPKVTPSPCRLQTLILSGGGGGWGGWGGGSNQRTNLE